MSSNVALGPKEVTSHLPMFLPAGGPVRGVFPNMFGYIEKMCRAFKV